MKYDFTSILERHGKDAVAVDGLGAMPGLTPEPPKEGFDSIPMWIADMNFAIPPVITDAVIERAKHPAFGYFLPPEEYYNAIINWHRESHQVEGLTPECIGYANGVIGGIISALNVFCCRGDKVLLHSPTYTGFTWGLEANGYKIIHSPLIKDENDVWRMDYEDMEKKITENCIHATVFCSPHNPSGRVWERWEIERAMELFRKHDVMVVSDEIWSDLTLNGHKHVPTQSVSEDARNRTVAMYAPSKTFNLAGLVGSYHIIYNKYIRDQVVKEASLSRFNEMNVLSMHALIGAYSAEGREWAEELRQVLADNIEYAYQYIKEHFDGVEVSKPEGTYMMFLDCTKWCREHGETIDELIHAGYDVGIAWQDGRQFQGKCHVRLNLALPLERVKEAFERMDQYIFNAQEG